MQTIPEDQIISAHVARVAVKIESIHLLHFLPCSLSKQRFAKNVHGALTHLFCPCISTLQRMCFTSSVLEGSQKKILGRTLSIKHQGSWPGFLTKMKKDPTNFDTEPSGEKLRAASHLATYQIYGREQNYEEAQSTDLIPEGLQQETSKLEAKCETMSHFKSNHSCTKHLIT